jgi:ankyrin repeat protein
VTCALAKALSAWLKESVQPQAKALLNSPVTELHVGSHTCRNRNGGADLPLSEHALANAIDVSDFVLASGARVAVNSWSSDNPPLPMPNPGRVPASTVSVQRVSVDLDDPEREFLKSGAMTPVGSLARWGLARMMPTRAIFTST